MIVDTSAVIAAVTDEVDARRYVSAMARNPVRMSAATYLETGIVIDRRHDPTLSRTLDTFLQTVSMQVEALTLEQATVARQAYRDFGKHSGHPANLNFGDCFSYALASVSGEPLLYKGNDFVHTDLRSALEI